MRSSHILTLSLSLSLIPILSRARSLRSSHIAFITGMVVCAGGLNWRPSADSRISSDEPSAWSVRVRVRVRSRSRSRDRVRDRVRVSLTLTLTLTLTKGAWSERRSPLALGFSVRP